MSQLQIQQMIEMIQSKPIGTREKSEWIDRLQTLNEEQLQDLWTVLNTKKKSEMEDLKQKNIVKINGCVTELENLTKKGVKLIYQKGEEINRQSEEVEKNDVLAELETA